jgi:hypothetical protein
VVGTVLTNMANLVVTGLMKRSFPDGIPVAENGAPSRQAPAAAERYWRYFRVMRPLNRVLAAAAIGLTPRVNFNILRSYRPGIVYRLFT